ncbi:MAG: hypothetical protein V4440_12535, partial [Pseudomonadota bacterium]
ISLDQTACYTAVTIVDVDVNNDWYLKVARRARLTATQTVNLVFQIQEIFKCSVIGVEAVAYQTALIHFIRDEMRKRKITVPIYAVKRGPEHSKMMRIRSLVPRFENQGIKIKRGLIDFEDEYSKFPRGTYVDILDALSSIGEYSYPPVLPNKDDKAPPPNHPDYEKWYIKNLTTKNIEDQDNG